jgi:serine protease Do
MTSRFNPFDFNSSEVCAINTFMHITNMVRTVKGWISECDQKRAEEQQFLRSKDTMLRSVLLVGLLFLSGSWIDANGQPLRNVFRKVEQAVVIIRTEEKAFAPNSTGGMVSANGLGSGVLISSDGKILTAAHLVQAADATTVEFSDGELIPARVLGAVRNADVALIQLEHNPARIVVATLGDSDKMAVGDEVFVIGAPYGLSHTLTAGHISSRHSPDNKISDTSLTEFLQTDAAINDGNSGGPMFNMDGEVIGIVSNILSKSGGSEGLGFAATSNMARQLLLDQKPFWLGVEGILLNGDLARSLNVSQPAALLVQRVAARSPAARAGIRAGSVPANIEGEDLVLGGDIILSINGLPFEATNGNSTGLYASLSKLKPGDSFEIKILRQGQPLTLTVK